MTHDYLPDMFCVMVRRDTAVQRTSHTKSTASNTTPVDAVAHSTTITFVDGGDR